MLTIGTPAQVADVMEHWFHKGAADGFNVMPPILPTGLTDFVDQVVPAPYETIHAHSMVPAAHLFWSSVWAGIAAGAVDRSRKYMRKATEVALER